MIFHRERGIQRGSPKDDLLSLEPAAYIETVYRNATRVFHVRIGVRTLSSGTQARKVWSVALKKIKLERGIV